MDAPPLTPAPASRGATIRSSVLACLGTACIAVAAARAEPVSRYEFVAPHMGTQFRLVFFAPDAATAESAARAAFARVAEINRIASDYDPESEVEQLARQPAGVPVTLSADLFHLLQRSQELAAQSAGGFDVTLGPVVRLWRETRRTKQLPSGDERATTLAACGHDKLRLAAATRTATLTLPGMRLDLGGIAKGCAADEALAVLAQRGIRHAMVAAGGDLALGDPPPDAEGWRIALAPFGDGAHNELPLIAANVGISTSGDTEQFVEIAGVRYSHIVNPTTGLGLTTRAAVTVIAPNATLSDGWATACSVLAATTPEKIRGCAGDSIRVIVFRPDDQGNVRHETHGTGPRGVRTTL